MVFIKKHIPKEDYDHLFTEGFIIQLLICHMSPFHGEKESNAFTLQLPRSNAQILR